MNINVYAFKKHITLFYLHKIWIYFDSFDTYTNAQDYLTYTNVCVLLIFSIQFVV